MQLCMQVYLFNICSLITLVVSLEESEYTVAEGDDFTLTITLNDEASEDFIVEVNVTDETAIGTYILRTLLHYFFKCTVL